MTAAITAAVDAARREEAARQATLAAEDQARQSQSALHDAKRAALTLMIEALSSGSPSEDVAAVIDHAREMYGRPDLGLHRRGVAGRIAREVGLPTPAVLSIIESA